MKDYFYKAVDKKGNAVNGKVQARDDFSAAKLVREKGLIVVGLKPAIADIGYLFAKLTTKIKGKDVSTFTRQFATMIGAGLPVTDSLSVLRLQSKSSFQPIISQILSDVEDGESLSNAFSRHPDVFSPTYIALIKAAELGGVLDTVLTRLADDLEKNEEFKGKVKGALIYPIIIVIGMVIVATLMMVFVVPRLLSLYSEFNATLPLPTRILIFISNTLSYAWPIILIGIFAGAWGYSLYKKTPAGKKRIDELMFKIPIAGPLMRQITLTELTRTLSLLVGTGVSILDGLSVSIEVVGNSVIADALKDVASQVEKGFPVAYSFAKHPEAFPYLLSQMMAVGEETGKMQEVLEKVSKVFETDGDQKVKTLTAAVEPLVMVLLGLGVAFLVVSTLLPIYNLTSQF